MLTGNFDFRQWLYACMDENNLVIKEQHRPDGSTFRPEPLVWRTSWDAVAGKSQVHYKSDLSVVDTFDQSEWGPWQEVFVDYEDPETNTVVKRRVLRTVPEGVDFMLKMPDPRVDPGLEEFLTEADWSRERVLKDLQKVTYPATASPSVKEVWATLGEWHRQHQHSADLGGTLRVQFDEAHMGGGGAVLGASLRGWHQLWATLLRFSPRPPAHGAVAGTTASIAAAARAKAAAIARAAAAPARAAEAPLASAVNVVNHTGYTSSAAAFAKLNDAGGTYLKDNIGVKDALFWVELGYKDPRSELQVGLCTLTAAPAGMLDAQPGFRWVQWYNRKSRARLWSTRSVAFTRAIVYEGQRPVAQVTLERERDLLPVALDVSKGSTADDPTISALGRRVLLAYLHDHRPGLVAAVDADEEEGAGGPDCGERGRGQGKGKQKARADGARKAAAGARKGRKAAASSGSDEDNSSECGESEAGEEESEDGEELGEEEEAETDGEWDGADDSGGGGVGGGGEGDIASDGGSLTDMATDEDESDGRKDAAALGCGVGGRRRRGGRVYGGGCVNGAGGSGRGGGAGGGGGGRGGGVLNGSGGKMGCGGGGGRGGGGGGRGRGDACDGGGGNGGRAVAGEAAVASRAGNGVGRGGDMGASGSGGVNNRGGGGREAAEASTSGMAARESARAAAAGGGGGGGSGAGRGANGSGGGGRGAVPRSGRGVNGGGGRGGARPSNRLVLDSSDEEEDVFNSHGVEETRKMDSSDEDCVAVLVQQAECEARRLVQATKDEKARANAREARDAKRRSREASGAARSSNPPQAQRARPRQQDGAKRRRSARS